MHYFVPVLNLLLCCPHYPPVFFPLLLPFCVVSPVSALLHLLDMFPFATTQTSPPHPRQPLLQPKGIAVLLQGAEGRAHHSQVVFVALAGVGTTAQLHHGVLPSLRLAIQLALCNEL